MTQKEEARALVDNFLNYVECNFTDSNSEINNAKQCALIAVNFAMNSKYSFQPMYGGWVSGKLHYEELKQEIDKL